MRNLIFVALLWLAAVGLALSCAGPDGSEAPASPQPAPVGGGAPPTYEEPQRVTEGEYRSPATDFMEEGLAAEAIDDSKPVFRGTVNGFRLFSFEDGMAPDVPCTLAEGETLVWGLPDEAHPSPINPTYLPPGTFAIGPVGILLCPDGTLVEALQDFSVSNATFDIRYDVGRPIVVHEAAAERVEAGTINGQPAVIIRPLIPEGWGPSQVVFQSGQGYLTVLSFDMPLEETLKVAKGLQ